MNGIKQECCRGDYSFPDLCDQVTEHQRTVVLIKETEN